MKKIIRLGTRDSPLAMWQAELVRRSLHAYDIECDIIAVKSEGDIDLVTPLYAMGVQGVFTKTLDAHLLSGHIDIAVHSMKDVPVQPAQGLMKAAVLPRADAHDVIVWREGPVDSEVLKSSGFRVGTGSVRRKSQWLHQFPLHEVENLRGNVQTRMRKLEESGWVGAVFAAAGLQRMDMTSLSCTKLDWMIPAPAQGAIMVVCREEDKAIYEGVSVLNDDLTDQCVTEERIFLNALHGGCSAPIGAYMFMENEMWHFRGCVSSLDGKEMIEVNEVMDSDAEDIGLKMAEAIYAHGGKKIIDEIRDRLKV